MKINSRRVFKEDFDDAFIYSLENARGMTVQILTVGATILSLKYPLKGGGLLETVLSHEDLGLYKTNPFYLGATVGRCANRIRKGSFTFDGKPYQLEKNSGDNHLHGGSSGYSYRNWSSRIQEEKLILSLESPDGDGGYPGEIHCQLAFTLSENDVFTIDYYVETPDKSFANLSNHTYFNLNHDKKSQITNHLLTLYADEITDVDQELLPTGNFLKVEGTPLDFQKEKEIGRDIDVDFELINRAGGYDYNYCLNNKGKLKLAATTFSPNSGIGFQFYTTSPGFQFYSGNNIKDRGGYHYGFRSGFCLEPQFYPDAINHSHFPSPILDKFHPQKFTSSFHFFEKT